MAAIVYQTNKKTGVTYAYKSVSFWDKEKQQSRAKRTCIGKVDPETKKIIPTRKRLSVATEQTPTPGPVPIKEIKRSFYGATYLFDAMGEKLGITTDLKRCFPDTAEQILSTAYYLILEDRNSLSRFAKWAATHNHPYGKTIPSQRSSELFASITEADREHFFRLQGRRRVEQEYWAYDTTSISSYAETLKQVKFGVNKEHDRLPQINLALLFGERSNLPFYYRKLAGNIPDVKTLKHLLADMDFLGFSKVKLVMDRGFYSQDNINALYTNHLKFLVAAKISLSFVKQELDQIRTQIRSWEHYHQGYEVFACSRPINWKYTHHRRYKGDIIKEDRRMYLHIYYNAEKAVASEKDLHILLSRLEGELASGKRDPEHEKQYAKYFTVTRTPKRGITVRVKDEVLVEAKKNYGYFVLLSNEIKDPIEALEIYRNKDLVEKAFGNLKERLNMRRTLVSSDRSLDGKLFVEFVALIYLSYIKKKMQEKDLFKTYTMQGLIDELDVIECFEQPRRKLRVGEITRRQIGLFEALDIAPPASLH